MKLRIQPLHLPFQRAFTHAAATRAVSHSVWVEAESPSGQCGFGEGCPRTYVTGESIESALAFFDQVRAPVEALTTIDAVRTWVGSEAAAIDAHPAAWCAIELALLDALARDQGQPVEALLSLPPVRGPFRYTAVLGAEEPDVFRQTLQRYRAMQFRDFKMKLSGMLSEDRARLAIFAEDREPSATLRFDANNRWPDASSASEYLRALQLTGAAIEEPVAARNYDELRRFAEGTGSQIILDESFVRIEQLEALAPLPGPWIINVRLSKMGGLLRSLALARRAREASLPIIVGCQVGETSLLTRAALTLVQAIGPEEISAQEGAFGRYLLAHDVVDDPLQFGPGGWLDVVRFGFERAAGFGLHPRLSSEHA